MQPIIENAGSMWPEFVQYIQVCLGLPTEAAVVADAKDFGKLMARKRAFFSRNELPCAVQSGGGPQLQKMDGHLVYRHRRWTNLVRSLFLL